MNNVLQAPKGRNIIPRGEAPDTQNNLLQALKGRHNIPRGGAPDTQNNSPKPRRGVIIKNPRTQLEKMTIINYYKK